VFGQTGSLDIEVESIAEALRDETPVLTGRKMLEKEFVKLGIQSLLRLLKVIKPLQSKLARRKAFEPG